MIRALSTVAGILQDQQPAYVTDSWTSVSSMEKQKRQLL